MRPSLLAALLLLPSLAFGQAKGPITSRQIGPLTPARYVTVSSAAVLTVASGAAGSVYVPWAGRLVDVIVYQAAAGTGGTSYTLDVTKAVGGASLLSTLGVVTLASGADKLVDAKSELVLPSGWTRPVIKTDGTQAVTKGQKLLINTVETGTYSPHATVQVTLIFEPLN